VRGATDLADAVLSAFQRVHETAFAGDQAANAALQVTVTDVLIAGDTPTIVLLTPWTLNGLAFPPDDRLPEHCEVAGRTRPVYRNSLAGLGEYYSVNLVPNVSRIATQDEALSLAHSLAEPWRDVVAKLRDALSAANPTRRQLLDPRAWGR
jgi:hypothetical protein